MFKNNPNKSTALNKPNVATMNSFGAVRLYNAIDKYGFQQINITKNRVTIGTKKAKRLVEFDLEEFATMTREEFDEEISSQLRIHNKRASESQEILANIEE